MPETVLLGFRRGGPRRLLVVQGPKGDEGEQGLPGATLASGVSFTPAGSISATTVQGALVELDTDKQPVDTDLTTIAGLDSTTAGALVTDGGGWIRKSYAQLKTALGLSKADLGLSAVDNTSDAAKPLSSAAVTALAAKADLVGGTVPASQLPSYVDDVLEFANLAAFPGVGETGKIYVAKDTNLTFRWTGSAYGVLDPSLALGETVSTAYRGDRGKTAYDHSQITSGNPHGTTYSDVGADAAGAAASAQAAAIAAAAADATTKANAAQSAATSAAATDATNKVATEATARNTAITNAVNALVAAAPGALDTLKELADALGDDPNFATTMTTALAGKASTTALTSEATSRLAADLLAAARNPDVLVAGAVTRDSNGAATVAAVVWPDGSPGTYTADALSSAFPGAVDGYHITYGSPVTKTYTQPTITRDAATGAATNVPAIAVT